MDLMALKESGWESVESAKARPEAAARAKMVAERMVVVCGVLKVVFGMNVVLLEKE